MSNEVKEIDAQNQTYYFFDNIIDIKNFDLINIKIDKKSYKNEICDFERSKYVKTNSVNGCIF